MSLIFISLGACFLSQLCLAQSITPAPTASCNYCFLAPGYTDVSSSDQEYLHFTAYSMTSAFAQDGFCFTNSGASMPLQTPYSIAVPPTATADPIRYQSAAATWFVDFLRVPDWGVCGENGSLAVHMTDARTTAFVNVAVPTILGAATQSPLASPANTVTLVVTQSSLAKSGSVRLSTGTKAAVGIVVALVVLALVVPGTVLWYKYRKQHAAMTEMKIHEKVETEMG